MGIAYNPTTLSWSVTPEKTDYRSDFPTDAKTDRKTDYATDLKTDLPTNLRTNHDDVYNQWKAAGGEENLGNLRGALNGLYVTYLGRYPSTNEISSWRSGLEGMGWESGSGISSTWFRGLRRDISSSTEAGNLEKTYADNKDTNERNALINEQNKQKNDDAEALNKENAELNKTAKELNEKNQKLNEEAIQLNKDNGLKNEAYERALQVAASTQGGDYVNQRDKFSVQQLEDAGLSAGAAAEAADEIQGQFKSFYLTEKLQRWDGSALGVQPPYGTFDPNYYKGQNPTVAKAWEEAVAKDDVDIVERYGENNFYWQHYTNIGKAQNLRGNKEEDTARANQYTEVAPTDQEIQTIRDLQLGVDSETITNRLLNVPEVSNEWTKARQGDPYWKQLAKEKYLDIDKPEEFAVLFRLSERPEDKQIILSYNINAGSGITELEEAIGDAINTKKTVDVKKFAAINQTILKDAIAELKKQRGREQMLSFFKGFEGYSEIVNINQELANSILGDTGVGGVLSFGADTEKTEESLIKSLQNVTGMRNNVTYNWQQWFDTQIKEKYGIDYSLFEPLEEKADILEAFIGSQEKVFDESTGQFNAKFLEDAGFSTSQDLISFLEKQGEEGSTILNAIKGDPGEEADLILRPLKSRIEADIKTLDESKDRGLALAYSSGEITEMMNVEAQFARDYIDEYLTPRFNTSRSMDEFIEYLDIRQEERNPFELVDIDDSLKRLGQKQSEVYLDQVKQQGPRMFDPNFYFNPTGDISRIQEYEDQKKTVEEDWEAAKAGDPYWAIQIYRFGIDVNNKAAFARMHFEVKGQGKGYDPTEDIVNAGKVREYIFNDVMPLLKEEADKAEAVFGTFITPEEFADELLEGLDPATTPDAWNEVLKRFGLSDFRGTIDDLKEYIAEVLRGGSAQEIREQIKYLNEKRKRPTQEILGLTYIERPEDFKNEEPKPTTQLYAVFQKAGYKGTEDEFYENVFPDLDRSEQALLTKAGSNEALETTTFDFSDPFKSLGQIEGFFPEYEEELKKEEAKEKAKEKADKTYSSFFRLDVDEEDDYEKSDAAKSFLGDFTSFFKGI